MNLMYDNLPESVFVNGKEYGIVTDFRDWIRFIDIATDEDISDEERLKLYKMYFTDGAPFNLSSGIKALIGFYICSDVPKAGKISGRALGKDQKSTFLYKYDVGYVLAAFREVYNINLRTIGYMHWYEFRWLFDALPDNTSVKERINYRAVNLSSIKDSKERSRIRKIQQSIELPINILDSDISDIFGGMM